jgi:hypothetical protein
MTSTLVGYHNHNGVSGLPSIPQRGVVLSRSYILSEIYANVYVGFEVREELRHK